ncbi:MAG: ATP-binding protein [Candidatus Obscuribacterales bacterium]|jgi:light-regulated signal transduction histidine kinase (bacteriophytochrome)
MPTANDGIANNDIAKNGTTDLKREQDRLVTLANCAREAIVTPGAIQPHGFMAVVSRPDLKILQLSKNFESALGRSIDHCLGKNVEEILAPNMMPLLEAFLDIESHKSLVPMPLRLRQENTEAIAVSCLTHRQGELFILEFEPDFEQQNMNSGLTDALNLSALLQAALSSVQAVESLKEVLKVCVEQIETLTGFDRVMIYKFDQEWHGEVLAESAQSERESYLGLHYPASDFPAQARELYKRNITRMIADVAYNSVPLEPLLNSATNQALDMSDCVLRSVSPMHVEYLQNMGVKATLTISLIVKGELWGLIACHHYSPKYLSLKTRSVCEIFGKLVALRILEEIANEKRRVEKFCRPAFAQILASVAASNGNVKVAFQMQGEGLIAQFNCIGAALVTESELVCFGSTPGDTQLVECAAWLSRQKLNLYSCNHLRAEFEHDDTFFALGGNYTGLLAIRTGLVDDQWLLLLRDKKIQSITWAGNPLKSAFVDELASGAMPANEVMQQPRRSFAMWREEVKDHSLPWSDAQITMAEYLRAQILDLTRANLHWVKAKADALQKERDDFVAALAHDLRLPVGGALRMLEFINAGRFGQTLPQFSDTLELLIESHKQLLERIKSILIGYQFAEPSGAISTERTELVGLISSAVRNSRPSALGAETAIKEDYCSPCFVDGNFDCLVRVVENLLSNAIKYSRVDNKVGISLTCTPTEALICVEDSGIGLAHEDIAYVFQRYWRARTGRTQPIGSGLGLFVCKQIVEAHKGTLWCESELGVGSKFFMRLPLVA